MQGSVPQFPDELTISVERMIRFCYLAKMTDEYAHYGADVLPLHLTRFGTMFFETTSFLYSLFDDRQDFTNLLKIWHGFKHPFDKELEEFVKKLEPFKKELQFVRNRIGFHGSLNRAHEGAGLGIFDVKSQRGREFLLIIHDTKNLAVKMIKWFVDERMDKAARPDEIWHAFGLELIGYTITASKSAKLPKT